MLVQNEMGRSLARSRLNKPTPQNASPLSVDTLLHNVGPPSSPISPLSLSHTILFSIPADVIPPEPPLLPPLPPMLPGTLLPLPTNKPSPPNRAGNLPFVRAAAVDDETLFFTKFAPAGTVRPRCREEDDRLVPRLPLAVPGIVPLASRCVDGGVTPAPLVAVDRFDSSVAAGRLSIRQSVSFTVNSRT